MTDRALDEAYFNFIWGMRPARSLTLVNSRAALEDRAVLIEQQMILMGQYLDVLMADTAAHTNLPAKYKLYPGEVMNDAAVRTREAVMEALRDVVQVA